MIETLPKQDLNPTLVQEESLLNWEDITSKFLKTFGKDVYESWIKNINLKNDQKWIKMLKSGLKTPFQGLKSRI